MTATDDWALRLGARHRWQDGLGWPAAAMAGGLAILAGALALQDHDRIFGRSDGVEAAILLDLGAASVDLAAVAAPEVAPAMPMTALRPMPAPDALLATGSRSSLPFREPSPLAQRTALPRLAAPLPEHFDIEPPPSAPVRVTKRPESRPQPRSEAPGTAHGERPRTARPTDVVPSRGGSVASGRSAAGPSAAKGDLSSLKARWGSEILARIQRQARGAPGREGIVALSLWVGRNGALLSASVARSSGNPRLDDMALRAVRSAGRFPPAPAALTEARYGFSLSIRFRR